MEKTMEKKEKILWFDAEGYDFALEGLEEMKKSAEYIISAWKAQPVLKQVKVTNEIFAGILKGRAEFIKDQIEKVIKQSQDAKVPGLSEQVDIQRPKLKGVDPERLERVCHSMHSWRPGSRSDRINVRMLTIEKEKPVVTDETLQRLKASLTVYDDGGQLAEMCEIGQIGESALQRIQDMIDQRQNERETASGFKMPGSSLLKMFVEPGQPGERGLFHRDVRSKKWKFNAQKLK